MSIANMAWYGSILFAKKHLLTYWQCLLGIFKCKHYLNSFNMLFVIEKVFRCQKDLDSKSYDHQ